MAIESNRDLLVWQKGMVLAKQCYSLVRTFPTEELYVMSAQIRKAAISVPANIAEGHGREHTRDFTRFLRISQGSLKEIETELLLSVDVDLAKQGAIEPILATTDELGRMQRALVRSLESKLI